MAKCFKFKTLKFVIIEYILTDPHSNVVVVEVEVYSYVAASSPVDLDRLTFQAQ